MSIRELIHLKCITIIFNIIMAGIHDGIVLQYPLSFNPWNDPNLRSKILFVGGIPKDCTDIELYEFLSRFDEVLWQRIEFDHITAQPKGFAYAVLKTPEGYNRVLNSHDHMIRDLQIGVSMWKDPKDYLNEKDKVMRRKIFVKRLHPTCNEAELYNYFSQFGRLEKSEIRRSHIDNTSRRIGFIIYENEDGANKCLDAKLHVMNGREIVVKKCKNTTEARKEKLNKSNYYDTIDTSRVQSLTFSNDSSWNANDSSLLSTSANNCHFNSASLQNLDEQPSFYLPNNSVLHATAKGNISFNSNYKKDIVPIEEVDEEPTKNILQPLNPESQAFFPFSNSRHYGLQDETFEDFLNNVEPSYKIEMLVQYYVLPDYA